MVKPSRIRRREAQDGINRAGGKLDMLVKQVADLELDIMYQQGMVTYYEGLKAEAEGNPKDMTSSSADCGEGGRLYWLFKLRKKKHVGITNMVKPMLEATRGEIKMRRVGSKL